MRKDKQPVPQSVQTAPATMQTQTPSTISGWIERIGSLERDLIAAERSLVERRTERRTAAGAAMIFDGDAAVVTELRAAEFVAAERADSLKCAIELAQAELTKLEAAARQARIEAQRQRRAEVAAAILQQAAGVDEHLTQAGDGARAIELLIGEYQALGGVFVRNLKGVVTRAMLSGPLRPYTDAEYVGGHEHLRPLVEQLGALAVVPGVDEALADRGAATQAHP